MISHPLSFLCGYVVISAVLSFVVVGPLAVFVSMLFNRRLERRYIEGIWLGASKTSLFFMILHYILYLRGYGITNWSRLFGDIFYPPNL
jgi:hypothetical protein